MKTIIIGKWFMLLNSLLTHENGKRDGVNFVNPISKRKLRRELRAAHVRLTVFKLFAVSYGPSCRAEKVRQTDLLAILIPTHVKSYRPVNGR